MVIIITDHSTLLFMKVNNQQTLNRDVLLGSARQEF